MRNVQSAGCEGKSAWGSTVSEESTAIGATISETAVPCAEGGVIRDWLVGTTTCDPGAAFPEDIRQQLELSGCA